MPEPRSAAGVRITLAPSIPHDLAALDRKRLGHDRDERITLRRADHRERDPGIARRRFDHGLARLERSAPLGVLDDGDREAILHGGQRIEELALHDTSSRSRARAG